MTTVNDGGASGLLASAFGMVRGAGTLAEALHGVPFPDMRHIHKTRVECLGVAFSESSL